MNEIRKTAFILDDEQHAIDCLKEDIEEYLENQISLVGSSSCYEEAFLLLNELSPDVLFIDINLGNDKTGFDFLDEIQRNFTHLDFSIIFTTGFSEYAIQAIKSNAFDYLLKPVAPHDLVKSINRLFKNQNTIANFQKQRFIEPTIKLNTQEQVHILKFDDIVRCEASKNYTYFFLKDKTRVLASKNIGEFEKKMKDFGFFRTHKTHLINLKYIRSFVKTDGGYIVLQDSTQIPLVKGKREDFLACI